MPSPKPTAPPFENPLVPNKKLLAIYTAMVELRVLDDHAAQIQHKSATGKPLSSTLGEEACRVATAINLMRGDLTSDTGSGVATDFLRGTKLPDILHRVKALAAGARKRRLAGSLHSSPGRLPQPERVAERLHLAIGAALALKAARRSQPGKLVLAYFYPADLSPAEWKQIFHLIASQTVPMLLVALPSPSSDARKRSLGQISHLSTHSGVPGILVDSADPVALYRVAQESIGRARSGGGAALMECGLYIPAPKRLAPADPIATLQSALLHRQLATGPWFNHVETAFQMRLQAADREAALQEPEALGAC